MREGAEDDEAPPPQPAGGGWPVHDVLGAIPFRHRLSTKLLGMSAVLALAAIAALWFAERRMQRDLVDQLERSTALLADAIEATTADATLAARPRHGYDVMARLGGLEGVERIRVLDKRGRVVFSTEPLDVGTTIEKRGRACAACHGSRAQPLSRAPAAERAEVLDDGGGRALSLIAPLHNARACSSAACHVHPPGRQVLGLLELRVSLGHLEASVHAFRRGFVLVVGAAVVLLAALLYLFGRAEVVEPVAALLEGTRRVARDQLDVEIRVHSQGELGLLAASFNEMTRSLRRLEDDLTGFMSGLERQVEARTADLKAAQETLVRAEKLSSLGKLSASIAHEINNPLAGILTFAKLVSRTLAEGPPDDAGRAALLKNLGLIERETQRCSAIVRNLLSFARERALQPKPMDPRTAIEEALSLLASEARTHGIEVERDLQDVPDVLADVGQLRQAFLNIAINACDAMGASGKLRVTTRSSEEAVEIAFADTGPGIPPDKLPHIFDPFFTTKEKGTGLGLSVVYGIVDRHGGVVEVESEVGRGTTFTIRLPIAATPAER
ncbi:MAG TPA: ATP-binding protein, partial [Anaeromyxobacter sp.]|nr:ATP-binding protein [Anaeromyxobacter sp.]